MKIGIILPRTRTGEYIYGKYLIDGLKRKDINVTILNEKLPFMNGSPTVKVLLGSLFFKKYLKKENFDVVHNIDNLSPYLFLSDELKETKFIVTVHDIAPVILPKIHPLIMRLHFKMILPTLLKNCTHIITPSRSTKMDLVEHLNLDSSKITVIPLGVEALEFQYKKYKSNLDKIKHKYELDFPVILYVGGDNPRKNLERLIVAYTKLNGEIPHRLVLAGPIKEKTIHRILEKNDVSRNLFNKIKLLGFIPKEDLPYLYSLADVFVYPSLYEGFGIPPLEALASRTAIVASNVSSIPEVVGKAAILVNPLDVNEIASGILKVIKNKNLREKLIHQGTKLLKEYTWEKTTKETVKVYKS